MIRVIQQSTAERKEETRKLFEQIRPLLDQGYSYGKAVEKITGQKVHNYTCGWFKELIDYGKEQGYDYHTMKWSRGGPA